MEQMFDSDWTADFEAESVVEGKTVQEMTGKLYYRSPGKLRVEMSYINRRGIRAPLMLAIFSEGHFYERRHVPRVTTTRGPRPEWNVRIFKEEKREDALRASLASLDNDSVQAVQEECYKIMGTTNMIVKV